MFLEGVTGTLNFLPLNNGSGFSPSGTTTLRIHLANTQGWPSSPAPTGANYFYVDGYANAANQPPPSLLLNYIQPVNVPTLTTITPHSLTPQVQVSTTDLDGDPVNHYAFAILDAQGATLWPSAWYGVGPQTVPAGLLHWNQLYALVGCGWDGVDPVANYPGGGTNCGSWGFIPANSAPPTPTQVSPVSGTVITNTSTPILVANPVTDPEGDSVSYHFQVSTGSDGTGVVADSGAIATTSWTVPHLADGTYYWRVQAQDSTGDPSGVSAWSSPPWKLLVDTTPPPAPTQIAPPNNQPVTTPTPQLSANNVGSAGGFTPIRYWFRIATGTDGQTGNRVDSGWIAAGATSTAWSPPQGSLQDGQAYTWVVAAMDANNVVGPWSSAFSFRVDLRLGVRASYGQDVLGPVTVNLANGNAITAYSSPPITGLGGNVGVSFANNTDQPINSGLVGSYYNDPGSTHSFTGLSPAISRRDPQINFNWGSAAAPLAPDPALPATNNYLVRWKGYLQLPASAGNILQLRGHRP